jgi:glucokinase
LKDHFFKIKNIFNEKTNYILESFIVIFLVARMEVSKNSSEFDTVALCGDVGGTNTNFGIAGFKNGFPKIIFKSSEITTSVSDFSELLDDFLEKGKTMELSPTIACFAVAGPVDNVGEYYRVKMSNTDLILDSKEIIDKTNLEKVLIINDFEAISYAINVIKKEDLITLNEGKPVKNGVCAILGAGTGLGKNILYYHERLDTYTPIPSEGGRADLPLLTEDELRLAEYIRKLRNIKGPICYEDVISGIGLENLYAFLQSTRYQFEPKSLTAIQISESKSKNMCSKETFEWFIRIYARASRNFALDVLARGGVYIAGGIAAKNIDSFNNFFDEFVNNEVYHELLKDIPVHLITNYDISLIGSAYALMARGSI